MSDATSSSRCGIPFDEFSALAGRLQEAAEAVLTCCRSVPGVDERQETADLETPKEQPLGECRQYCLPVHTLREERELLERYEADSFANALSDIHTELYTLVFGPLKVCIFYLRRNVDIADKGVLAAGCFFLQVFRYLER